jgi:hypothetical protein
MENDQFHQRLKEFLIYDPETGLFTKIRRNFKKPFAGTPHPVGYIRITIDKRFYLAHRLAWFYVKGKWPEADIDHINGDKTDNRFANLREASRSLNRGNSRGRHDSAQKFKDQINGNLPLGL